MGRQWTDEDIASVRQMLADGLTCAEIAERLGRTTLGVQQFVWRHRLRGRSSQRPSLRERVLTVLRRAPNRRATCAEIARLTGLRVFTVSAVLHRMLGEEHPPVTVCRLVGERMRRDGRMQRFHFTEAALV